MKIVDEMILVGLVPTHVELSSRERLNSRLLRGQKMFEATTWELEDGTPVVVNAACGIETAAFLTSN